MPLDGMKRELLPFVGGLEHYREVICNRVSPDCCRVCPARPRGRIARVPALIIALPMAALHITDIEAAINYWRARKPSPDGVTLAPEIRALAEVYALMVFFHEDEVAERGFPPKAWDAWLAWYDSTPDTPCIAICSTSQGDEICKGCGRTFEEVQLWPGMGAVDKRATWRRITLDATSWRFNRYAERAAEGQAEPPGAN